MQQVVFDIHDPSRISIPYGPLTLFQKDLLSIPFAKIPVFTFFGIFNVYVGGGINFGVGLYLEGVVRPLAPALDTTLTGTGRLGLEIGISADLVLGLVEGGAALGGEMCANVPLQITLSNPPNVDFNDPYIGGRLYLAYWASAFWGLVKTRGTTTLVDFGRGCPGRQITRQAAESALVTPSVLASPAVAASPSGRVLSAYVANTAAAGATPQVQIIARFQDPNTGAWSEPQALSNPAHSAQSPTVAFVGGNQTPMVAWTENTMTAAEAAAIGDNDNKKDAAQHIRQQEIFYSLWSDIGWSTPIALTNDKLGDGMAAAAGGQRTGVIAWTRDTDGDATTRTDQRIMVSLYNPKTQRFDAPTLLGNNQSGLNASVSVALNPYDIPIAAWVNDADGDLTTAEDRRLQVVSCCVRGDWVSLNPQPLPPRVDSPTVSAGLDGIRVAFLVREASKDGEVALLGPNGVLWLALYDVNNRWTVHPVRDADGQLVYAEQPVLQSNQNEALLLFRRFGQTNATSAFGQLGLSQMQGGAAPSPPIYLTDGPKQQWLPALAINPINAKAIVLHSSLPRSSAAVRAQTLKTLAATQALPRAQDHTLIGGDAPVESLTVENKGDPALDPLQVSRMSPMPGATIAVTTTVRNVGRGTASGLRVELYRGSVVGVPVAMHNLSKALSFNETATVTFSIVVPADLAPSGQLPLVARLVTSDDNLNTNNDYTTITIGRLSAPSRVELVGENAEWSGALDLTWSGNTGEYVTGYRVYRRASATERWAFVGESAVPSFTDTTVEKGTRYCYTVQAYNGQGALSPYGAETCAVFQVALSVQGIFLPLIWR